MAKAKDKWERKLKRAMDKHSDGEGSAIGNWSKKNAIALFAFTILVREGLESVVFLGGVGFDGDGVSLPIPAISGILAGVLVGYLLYRGGSQLAVKIFLIGSTVLLFFIAAGMMVKAVHEFEEKNNTEVFVWQLNCCDPEAGNGWSVFNAVFGWRNEATVGTLCAWFLYWVFVVLVHFMFKLNDARKEKKDIRQGIEEKESQAYFVNSEPATIHIE